MRKEKTMRAVNGFLENGRFIPLEVISVSQRVPAVIVFNDIADDENREKRMSWLKRLHNSISEADGEEIPDFPRAKFDHVLMDLSDEE